MSEAATQEPTYKPIGGGSFWPKDGDEGTSLIGVLLAKEQTTSRFDGKEQIVLTLQKPDEDIKKVGVTSGLKSSEPYMKPGRAYRITYQGKEKGKGPLPFKKFQVAEIENYDPKHFEVPF